MSCNCGLGPTEDRWKHLVRPCRDRSGNVLTDWGECRQSRLSPNGVQDIGLRRREASIVCLETIESDASAVWRDPLVRILCETAEVTRGYSHRGRLCPSPSCNGKPRQTK